MDSCFLDDSPCLEEKDPDAVYHKGLKTKTNPTVEVGKVSVSAERGKERRPTHLLQVYVRFSELITEKKAVSLEYQRFWGQLWCGRLKERTGTAFYKVSCFLAVV